MPAADAVSEKAAIVLCGGLSRRMGQPKYLMSFGDEILLQRMCRIVSEVVSQVVVVAAVDQEIPSFKGLSPAADIVVVRDEMTAAGPLAGLGRGLTWLNDTQGSLCAVFATSCDAPLLTPAVVRFLFEKLGTADAVAVTEDGFIHPLCAVYRASTAAVADKLLRADERRPRALLKAVNSLLLPVDQLREIDPRLDCLRNLNTPEEYLAAVRESGTQG